MLWVYWRYVQDYFLAGCCDFLEWWRPLGTSIDFILSGQTSSLNSTEQATHCIVKMPVFSIPMQAPTFSTKSILLFYQDSSNEKFSFFYNWQSEKHRLYVDVIIISQETNKSSHTLLCTFYLEWKNWRPALSIFNDIWSEIIAMYPFAVIINCHWMGGKYCRQLSWKWRHMTSAIVWYWLTWSKAMTIVDKDANWQVCWRGSVIF